jgi:sec-independent protein translocase protein TatC
MIMGFGDHLDELRTRLIWTMLGLGILFVGFLFIGAPLLEFLILPLRHALAASDQPPTLLATGPTETFAAYIKVSLVMALLVGVPWVLFQVWLFISPGLYSNERRFVYLLLPMSALLTAAGFTFLYKVLLPISLTFLIGFGSNVVRAEPGVTDLPEGSVLGSLPVLAGDPAVFAPGDAWVNETLGQIRICVGEGRVMGALLQTEGLISQQYRIGEYVSLVFWLGIVFAIAFQLPLVMMIAGWSGMVRADELTGFRKHVAFVCAIMGAIFTPQDPLSMILLGGALYMLYEFGLILMRIVPASRVAGSGAQRRTDGDEGDA